METQWIDPAVYGAYQQQLVDASASSMSEAAQAADAASSTGAATGEGACRFVHNQCDKELFTSEYLRYAREALMSSRFVQKVFNRIMCLSFFCGSGLVVECVLPSCQLVLGRFEEVAKAQPPKNPAQIAHVDTSVGRSSLEVGRDYPRQELFDEVKMPDQPFGRWFRGTAVPGASGRASFLLNGNRQSWHYGWQSSRLNCKNLHVFKVYVFNTSARGPATLSCVAAVASPAFRISSSRKARKTFRSPATLAPPMRTTMSPSTGSDVASPPGSGGVPSIDAFLATGSSRLDTASSHARYPASQPPSDPNPQTRDPARRERKRLTRSASLKTDYFTTVAFPVAEQPQQQRLPQFQEERASTPPLPSVGAFLSSQTASGRPVASSRTFHTRRSSLAALPMPSSAGMGVASGRPQRAVPVLTPITGMMQLRLENQPPPYHPPTATRLSAAALHQHAYSSARPSPYMRRESWSSGGPPGFLGGGGGGLPYLMMAGGSSSPDSYLNRKRNRSTDSDKAITAAIEASEKLHPTSSRSPIEAAAGSSATAMSPAVVAPVPTDSELYRRARILQLAFTIVKRIHRFDEVAAKQKEPKPKVYRHSFEMLTPPSPIVGASGAATPSPRKQTLVQIPLSNPKLLHLCSNLVTVCTSLVASGMLEDVRQKLHDCAQAGRGVLAAYAQLVDLLTDAVETQVARLPRRMHKSWGDAESADEGEWDLYEMLKSCEPWLLREPWWVVRDDDEQQQAGDREDGALRPLPYVAVFADYYHTIQEAVPSPQDLQVAASLRDAALTGVGGLTGEWRRHGEADDQLPPPRGGVAASAAASLSWLARCIHSHTTQVLHMTETATTMTLTLPHSLVSADAVLLLQLDQPEPTVVRPQDFFPFGWSRRRSLVAYRAWRVRDMADKNGSAVAVQFMRWPDAEDLQEVEGEDEEEEELEDDEEAEDSPEEPEEEPRGRQRRKRLRTRITMYFSVFSPTSLQLRAIVEASRAPAATLPEGTQPTEADMLQYFKSPSSWEMRSQISQQYEKNL
ncbi:hypothetical protein BBJ28_00006153 [Nothophytophthora sp. Chile5]|nr:hypothetical protein BBJ28_00006153 [Nothophytophthora sp. Chile5]